MHPFLKKIGIGIVVLFALIGVFFTAVFIGMQFGAFNIRGSIDSRNEFFSDAVASSSQRQAQDRVPKEQNTSQVLGTTTIAVPESTVCPDTVEVCDWDETREWAVIRAGLEKDDAVISRVSAETGVSKRMIAAVVFPEQARFFTSNREVFKRWFEPMKLLGSLSQFSLGVSGIKQETAVDIEMYAHDHYSPFYPGDGMSDLLAYPKGVNRSNELYNRLTDEKDHYYSYLYTAMFIREIQEQWKREGYDISKNPEAVVTLFNIGFQKSNPHPAPIAGGAPITLGGTTYSYGELGAYLYYSDELSKTFSR